MGKSSFDIIKDESVIAFKIDDVYKTQKCLDSAALGPARYAVRPYVDVENNGSRQIVSPPAGAADVNAENLCVAHIDVISKTPLPFHQGYWKIVVAYDLAYDLIFRNQHADIMATVHAHNLFNDAYVLYGVAINGPDAAPGVAKQIRDAKQPFVMVEAKAVMLNATLKPDEVCVSIKLFVIARLFSLICLNMDAQAAFLPPPFAEPAAIDDCECSGGIIPSTDMSASTHPYS